MCVSIFFWMIQSNKSNCPLLHVTQCFVRTKIGVNLKQILYIAIFVYSPMTFYYYYCCCAVVDPRPDIRQKMATFAPIYFHWSLALKLFSKLRAFSKAYATINWRNFKWTVGRASVKEREIHCIRKWFLNSHARESSTTGNNVGSFKFAQIGLRTMIGCEYTNERTIFSFFLSYTIDHFVVFFYSTTCIIAQRCVQMLEYTLKGKSFIYILYVFRK
jgi:hypothetical protein